MASGAGSTTSTIFDDVPRQPDILRITLTAKKSTMWTRFKKAMATLSPEELMKHLKETKDEIMMKLDGGEELTDEEIEFFEPLHGGIIDENTRQIQKASTRYNEDRAYRHHRGNEVQDFCSNGTVGLVVEDYLSGLLKKSKKFLPPIKEKIDWCFEKAKELFDAIYGPSLIDSIPTSRL